jgi:hypothetical protein
MSRISPTVLYWIAVVVFFIWYGRRRSIAAARRKELLGDKNPDDYSAAAQPRERAPLVVFAIIFAATLALIALQLACAPISRHS